MASFTRDRFTWLAYFMLGYFAYLQAALGPLVPFLRSELKLNYTVAGLHLSAFALGMAAAGLSADRLVRRWGRRVVLWAGGAGMAVGGVLLALGHTPAVTVGASLAMGFLGTWVLVMVQATLSDRHGEQRAAALTESNILASLTAALAPLLVGTLERLGMGWRGALYAGLLAWVALLAIFRGEPLPTGGQPDDVTPRASKLPPVFWAYWTLVLVSVSAEWCVIFWSADFLEKVILLPRADASTATGALFLGSVVGRAAGSRLTRHFSPDLLLLGAAGVALVGFPVFWLATFAALNVLGLFVTGLGVGNLFPFALSAASRVGQSNSNAASARISMASGLAILITPQLLGTLADQIGIKLAYSMVMVLLIAVLLVIFSAGRLAQRKAI